MTVTEIAKSESREVTLMPVMCISSRVHSICLQGVLLDVKPLNTIIAKGLIVAARQSSLMAIPDSYNVIYDVYLIFQIFLKGVKN